MKVIEASLPLKPLNLSLTPDITLPFSDQEMINLLIEMFGLRIL